MFWIVPARATQIAVMLVTILFQPLPHVTVALMPAICSVSHDDSHWRKGRDSNPRMVLPTNGFQDRSNKPDSATLPCQFKLNAQCSSRAAIAVITKTQRVSSLILNDMLLPFQAAFSSS